MSTSLLCTRSLARTTLHHHQFTVLDFLAPPTITPPPLINAAPAPPTPTLQPPANNTPTTPTPAAPVPANQVSGVRLFWQFITSDPQIKVCAYIIASEQLRYGTNQAYAGLALFLFLIVLVRVILSPTMGVVYVALTYSSIWLPQIARSAIRGRASGLSASYLIGTTACRLYLAMCTILFHLALVLTLTVSRPRFLRVSEQCTRS